MRASRARRGVAFFNSHHKVVRSCGFCTRQQWSFFVIVNSVLKASSARHTETQTHTHTLTRLWTTRGVGGATKSLLLDSDFCQASLSLLRSRRHRLLSMSKKEERDGLLSCEKWSRWGELFREDMHKRSGIFVRGLDEENSGCRSVHEDNVVRWFRKLWIIVEKNSQRDAFAKEQHNFRWWWQVLIFENFPQMKSTGKFLNKYHAFHLFICHRRLLFSNKIHNYF